MDEQLKHSVARRRIQCSECNNTTWHAISAAVSHAGGGEDEPKYEEAYQVVQCLGCDQLSFRRAVRDETDNWASEYEEIFPRRVQGRRELENSWLLPYRVRQIYRETYSALCNGMPILTAIGVRALVEAVCKEKGAEGHNLEERIDSLVTRGVLTRGGAEILHKARFLGNEAAHEIGTPAEDVLDAAMSVAEHLLQTAYIVEALAKRLPTRTPPEGDRGGV